MSFDTAGRTMMGVTSAQMADMVESCPTRRSPLAPIAAWGASDLLRTVLGFAAQGTERPLIAKGNAGIPKYHDGHIHL
jgi:5-methyltetrahydrofolate--homocysteine methyltransferase